MRWCLPVGAHPFCRGALGASGESGRPGGDFFWQRPLKIGERETWESEDFRVDFFVVQDSPIITYYFQDIPFWW